MKKVKPQFKLFNNSDRYEKIKKVKEGIKEIQNESGFGVLTYFMGYGKTHTSSENMEEGDVFSTNSHIQLGRKKRTLEQDIGKEGYTIKGFVRFLGYERTDNGFQRLPASKLPSEFVEIDDDGVKKRGSGIVYGQNRQTIKDIINSIEKKMKTGESHPIKSTREEYEDKRIVELYRHQFAPKIAEEYVIFCPTDLLPTLINIGAIGDIVVDEGVRGKNDDYYWGSFSSLSNKINKTSLALSNSSHPQPLNFPKRYGQNNDKVKDVGQEMEFLCQNMTFLLQDLYRQLEKIHTDKVRNNGVEVIDVHFNDIVDENWLKSFQKFKSLVTRSINGTPKFMIARRKAQNKKTVNKINHMEDVMRAITSANGQEIRAYRDGGTIYKVMIKKPLLHHLQEHSEDNDIFVLNSSVGCKSGKKLWTEYYPKMMKEFSEKVLTDNDLLSSRYQRSVPDKEPVYTEEVEIWENYQFNEGQRFVHFGFDGRDNSNSRSLNTNNLVSPRFEKVAKFESFVNMVTRELGSKNLAKMSGKKFDSNDELIADKFPCGCYENFATLRGASLEDKQYMFVNGMIRPNEKDIKKSAYNSIKKEPEIDLTDKENKKFDQGLVGYKDEIADMIFDLEVVAPYIEKCLRLRDYDDESKASVLLGQKPPQINIPTIGNEEELCRWIIDETWKLWKEEKGWESIGEFLDFVNDYFDTQDWKIIEGVSYSRKEMGTGFGDVFKVKSDDDGNRELDLKEKNFLDSLVFYKEEEISVSEVADIFDVTNNTVRNWVEDMDYIKRDNGVLSEV